MNTYIVRVYQKGNCIHNRLLGIVEKVGAAEKKAFTDFEDLWEILNPKQDKPDKKKKAKQTPKG
jgi:hypothetical protein